MANKNPIFEAIEDEIIKSLEQGAKLPPIFTITLADVEFKALLPGLVNTATQLPLPTTTTKVKLNLLGHSVVVRSEVDADDWTFPV
jgi:hypothetical protein